MVRRISEASKSPSDLPERDQNPSERDMMAAAARLSGNSTGVSRRQLRAWLLIILVVRIVFF
jgi:hypothetical protein